MAPWVGAACRRAAMPKLLRSYCPGNSTVTSQLQKQSSVNVMQLIRESSGTSGGVLGKPKTKPVETKHAAEPYTAY